MDLRLISVCCENKANGNGGDADQGAAPQKNEKKNNPSSSTILARSMTKAIRLYENKFVFEFEKKYTKLSNGIQINYRVVKKIVEYDEDSNPVTKTFDFGQMVLAILANKNRYLVGFHSNKDSKGTKEDIALYEECVSSNKVYDVKLETVIEKFESCLGDKISGALFNDRGSIFSGLNVLREKKMKKVFGTSGDGWLYTKQKAIAYMTKGEKKIVPVITVKEPRNGIKGPRIAILCSNGKDIITFTGTVNTPVIGKDNITDLHILSKGKEV